eukprot:TRINITY_DN12353_c0_g1_i1.p1 TRINITY_DN12353_c0_g1~~TRINITY_DN12353_c0_g1_i1.p1  ORF type:complete len:218 (-),score=27.74 TRINITY_DN12353_c0_g1_i1:622-1203(-)
MSESWPFARTQAVARTHVSRETKIRKASVLMVGICQVSFVFSERARDSAEEAFALPTRVPPVHETLLLQVKMSAVENHVANPDRMDLVDQNAPNDWEVLDGTECNGPKHLGLGIDGIMFAGDDACRRACEDFGAACSAFDMKSLSSSLNLCVFHTGRVSTHQRSGVRCWVRKKFYFLVAGIGRTTVKWMQQPR